jgi:hypothetical protein
MLMILVEWNGIGDLNGHAPDTYLDVFGSEHRHAFYVKLRHGSRHQRETLRDSISGLKKELMPDEVERDLKRPFLVGNPGSGQASRCDI